MNESIEALKLLLPQSDKSRVRNLSFFSSFFSFFVMSTVFVLIPSFE
jgi:hypothetical protein